MNEIYNNRIISIIAELSNTINRQGNVPDKSNETTKETINTPLAEYNNIMEEHDRKIEEIKAAVKNGTYHIDEKQVARAIIQQILRQK
jgi:anti-sigma28 factor (negative regulator of flagellin synthesis)